MRGSRERKAEGTTLGEGLNEKKTCSSMCKLKPIGFLGVAAAWLDLASQVMSTVQLIFSSLFLQSVVIASLLHFRPFLTYCRKK